jgi:hypothetical protein
VPDEHAFEDRIAEREELRLLQMDLADLPDRQRAALVLRELNGLSHAEIGVVLELSPGAVKQAIFEARTALFSCREGREMECHDVRRMLSDGDGRVLRGRGIRAHLRSCPDCARFRRDLEQRPRALKALVPPLPIGAAAALLAELLGAGTAAKLIACVAIVGGGGATLAVEMRDARQLAPPPAAAEASPQPKPKRDPKPPPVVVPAVATSEPQPAATVVAAATKPRERGRERDRPPRRERPRRERRRERPAPTATVVASPTATPPAGPAAPKPAEDPKPKKTKPEKREKAPKPHATPVPTPAAPAPPKPEKPQKPERGEQERGSERGEAMREEHANNGEADEQARGPGNARGEDDGDDGDEDDD